MDDFKITVDDNLHKLFRKQYSYADEIRFGGKEVAIIRGVSMNIFAYPFLFDDIINIENPNWKFKYNVSDRIRYGLILKYMGVKEIHFLLLDKIMYLTIYYTDGNADELSVDTIQCDDIEKLT